MIKFRDLKSDEIELRIQQVKGTGVQLLLYKNARCDMDILDETVGVDHWQRKHYQVKETMCCSVGILCEDAWIWKDDAGAETKVEAEKGEASDSFKRACVNWGIGRKLYTSPFIWIMPNKITIDKKEIGGKTQLVVKERFRVGSIKYDDKRITSLTINAINKDGTEKQVYRYTDPTTRITPETPPQELAPGEIPICKKCGKEIKGLKKQDGSTYNAQEVAYKLGGLCRECYNNEQRV